MKPELSINYHSLMEACREMDVPAKVAYLTEELPYLWLDKYLLMTTHEVQPLRIVENDFLYIYDFYSGLVAEGAASSDAQAEDRILGVLGRSKPVDAPRNASRQRSWAGLNGPALGTDNDKGHFIAHTIGGGFEINMFLQRRHVNRGWSEQGKVYRAMEEYCVANPGTFLFSRPTYEDASAKPSEIEFGLLKADGNLWVELFDN